MLHATTRDKQIPKPEALKEPSLGIMDGAHGSQGQPLLLLCGCGAVIIWLHIRWTFRVRPLLRSSIFASIFPIAGARKSNEGDSHELDTSCRFEDELFRLQAELFKLMTLVFVQLHVLVLLASLADILNKGDALSYILLVIYIFNYLAYWMIVLGTLVLTPWRLNVICCSLHSVIILVLLGVGSASKDDYIGIFGLVVLGEIVFCFICPSKGVNAFFAACYFGAHFLAAWCAGISALSHWFMLTQIVLLTFTVAIPIGVESLFRAHVEESLQSQGTHSLLKAFRQMLKGICDGDLLLDSSFRIRGNASCLQRLLGLQEDFSGRSFLDLAAPHPDANTRSLSSFALDESTSQASNDGAPRCLRMVLKGESNREVAVDVFHVALPHLGGADSLYHLIAMREDTESRAHRMDGEAECEAGLDGHHIIPETVPVSFPHGSLFQLPGRSKSAGSDRSRKSGSEAEPFEDLDEVHFLLNASTEDLDIEEVELHFSRGSQDSAKLAIPTLRQLLRPLDWQQYHAKIQEFIRGSSHRRRSKTKRLAPMMLCLPGDPKTFIRASSVSLECAWHSIGGLIWSLFAYFGVPLRWVSLGCFGLVGLLGLFGLSWVG